MEFKEIDISQIFIPVNGTRTEPNYRTQDIQDLAYNIKTVGLVNPIIIFKNSDGKFQILAGQRRYTAFEFLNEKYPGEGFDKIICNVVDPIDEDFKKIINISESFTQLPMNVQDHVDAISAFFDKYNDERIVSKKLGISVKMVRKYVKVARLPKIVKENLDSIDKNPKTALNIALDANDALGWSPDNGVSEQKVYDLAIKLGEKKKYSQEEYVKLKQAAEEHPGESLEQIEQESLKLNSPITYNVILEGNMRYYVEALAEKHALSPEELIIDALNDYLDRNHSENND